MLDFDFLPDYSHLTPGLIGLYTLAGFFGALVRVAWLNKPLKGFYRAEDGAWRMGFFAEVIIAIGVAITVDGHPIRAGIAAVFAPFILDVGKDFVINRGPAILETMLKGSGNKEGTDGKDGGTT